MTRDYVDTDDGYFDRTDDYRGLVLDRKYRMDVTSMRRGIGRDLKHIGIAKE